MNPFSRQRDTPTRSPFAKSPDPRFPSKTSRPELGLSLEQVIGTTCSSVNCFDAHAESRSFAYTAGAAAVIATVDQDLKVKQRFFRANALQTGNGRAVSANGSLHPSSTPYDVRSRVSNRSREESPFSSASTQEATDSPGGRSGGARDRVKAATAISLSPNGRWLVVGEVSAPHRRWKKHD